MHGHEFRACSASSAIDMHLNNGLAKRSGDFSQHYKGLLIMYANAKCCLQKTLSVKRNFLYNQVESLFAYLLCENPAVSWFKSANYTTDYSAQTENFAQQFVAIQLVQCQDPRSNQENPKFDLYFTLSPSIYEGPQGILWFGCVPQLGSSLFLRGHCMLLMCPILL
jgi:hypothetical protein